MTIEQTCSRKGKRRSPDAPQYCATTGQPPQPSEGLFIIVDMTIGASANQHERKVVDRVDRLLGRDSASHPIPRGHR
jgi:hypothetical protein